MCKKIELLFGSRSCRGGDARLCTALFSVQSKVFLCNGKYMAQRMLVKGTVGPNIAQMYRRQMGRFSVRLEEMHALP